MGTDIHLLVERRDRDGHWHLVPNPTRPCAEHLHDKSLSDGKNCYWCNGTGKRTEPFYDHRDYDVFAILADVRNGTGFAGVRTGDGFTPLTPPRGLPNPDDASAEVADAIRAATDTRDFDGGVRYLGDHSFSWLRVDEILRGGDHDPSYWMRKTRKQGVVSPSEYLNWKSKGRPESWCGDVSGGGVVKVTPSKMGEMILAGDIVFTDESTNGIFSSGKPYRLKDGTKQSVYTTVEWSETYAEAACQFLAIVYRDLIPLGNPCDTRIVFGFDS